MELIFGYDILTYNGPIPNCLNPKFLPTIYCNNFVFNDSIKKFKEEWGSDIPVFNSNDFNQISQNKSIYSIISDRKNNINYKWFYLIEPHSGLDLFFGKHDIHNEFVLNFIPEKTLNEIKFFNVILLFN